MSDSKETKALKVQFKADKEAGATVYKTFKAYQAAYLLTNGEAPIDVIAPAKAVVPENIDQVKLPTIAETLAIVAQALEITETAQVVAEVKIAKSVIAAEIFAKAVVAGPLVRADVIKAFMAEAGLSKNGANTYYHNLKSKAGLVVHKTA